MRVLILLYGVVVYGVFFATFLYLIGFVSGVGVPKSIDDGIATSVWTAVGIDVALIALFALQHTIMARQGFKAWWTKIVPPPAERSTFVLITSVILIILYWQWRPITTVVWQVDSEPVRLVIWALCWIGWAIALISTFIIDHFELFGLKQTWVHARGRTIEHPPFRVTAFYRYVRHPLMLGLLIAFWAAPTMTAGRLLFSAAMTAYILVAVRIEERDLVGFHGRAYEDYQRSVSMLLPFGSRKAPHR